MLKKYRYKNTDVYIYEQESNEQPRLLQHERLLPLSWIRDERGQIPNAIINCSYFTPQWVIGRNQGDLHNDTYNDKYNGQYCDLVFTKDGKYHYGKLNSWDLHDNVVAGMSLATFLIQDGVMKCCESPFAQGKLNGINPQTAIGITSDNRILLIKCDGRRPNQRGLDGYDLIDLCQLHYSMAFLGQCDGGGSSEMIVNGTIKGGLSDNRERPMWNGFALVHSDTPPKPNNDLEIALDKLERIKNIINE